MYFNNNRKLKLQRMILPVNNNKKLKAKKINSTSKMDENDKQ